MGSVNIGEPKTIFNKSHLAYGLLMTYDLVAVALSYFFALWLRFDGKVSSIPGEYFTAYKSFIPWYLIICIGIFTYSKLYHSIWRFASVTELERVVIATAITGLLHVGLITVLYKRMPISYYVMGIVFQFCFTIGARFSYRLYLTMIKRRKALRRPYVPVMIIGAGDAGREVIREIRRTDSLLEEPVCLIDDFESKWGKDVEGVPVLGGRELILDSVKKYDVKKIYFSIPTCPRDKKRDILNICKETDCEIMSLPGIFQIAQGKVTLSDMKKVEIEDLLGRDTVKTDMEKIYAMISGKVVLITGGGGSIGSEIALQVSRHNPKKLIIFDIYENNAYYIQNKILSENPNCNLEVLIGSVRDSRRVNNIFETYRPDLVYHAAAHKHVPLMEYSPCEAIKNNVVGTYKVAYAAMMYGTKRMVLISTDKAVNPTNVMGASKRMCELIIQSFDKKIKAGKASEIPPLYIHEENPKKMYESAGSVPKDVKTEFVAVRFGADVFLKTKASKAHKQWVSYAYKNLIVPIITSNSGLTAFAA